MWLERLNGRLFVYEDLRCCSITCLASTYINIHKQYDMTSFNIQLGWYFVATIQPSWCHEFLCQWGYYVPWIVFCETYLMSNLHKYIFRFNFERYWSFRVVSKYRLYYVLDFVYEDILLLTMSFIYLAISTDNIMLVIVPTIPIPAAFSNSRKMPHTFWGRTLF